MRNHHKSHERKFLHQFCLALLLLVAGTLNAGSQRRGEDVPMLVAVEAPARFELNDRQTLALLIGIESVNIGPTTKGHISVTVLDRAGNPIEVPILNSLTARDLFAGRNQIAIEIGHAARYRGMRFPVLICAHSEEIAGTPCAAVDLLDRGDALEEAIKDKQELVALLKKRFTDIGCRCKSAAIRMDPADTNHGSLGSFTAVVGGAQYGPYHQTDKAAGTYTSVYKFEPHFEIEILNRPDKPEGTDAEAWSEVEKLFPALCSEGQKINGTTTLNKGLPAEEAVPMEVKVPPGTESFPYEDTTDPAKFTWDGHGYRVTGDSPSPKVKGAVKAWESNVIHWLDSPGFAAKLQTRIDPAVPVSQKNQFHAFVHGTTGRDEDNCDCFFGLETGVVGVNGAEASVLLTKPECK